MLRTNLEFAAIVDSRGSLSIGFDRSRNYWYEQYRLSGDIELLNELQERFGGSLSPNGKHCSLVWRVTAGVCQRMLTQIRPFLIDRAGVADILIEFGALRAAPIGPDLTTSKQRMVEAGPRFRARLLEERDRRASGVEVKDAIRTA